MATTAISEIENQFAQLPPEAQLSVLERLAHHVRAGRVGKRDDWDADLAAMAADPDIQRELREISAEFAATEADGLGKF
jgi:hypothetical protein